MCMCVFMRECVCAHVWVCVHACVCMSVCFYAYVYLCMYVCAYKYVCAHMWVCVNVCLCRHTHGCTHATAHRGQLFASKLFFPTLFWGRISLESVTVLYSWTSSQTSYLCLPSCPESAGMTYTGHQVQLLKWVPGIKHWSWGLHSKHYHPLICLPSLHGSELKVYSHTSMSEKKQVQNT